MELTTLSQACPPAHVRIHFPVAYLSLLAVSIYAPSYPSLSLSRVPLPQMMYDSSVVFRPTTDDNDNRPPSTPLAHVWVRQRQDDTAFLLPEALAGEEIDTAAAVTDGSGAEGGSEKTGTIVTMLLGEEYEEEDVEEREREREGRGGFVSSGGYAAGVESGAGTSYAAHEVGDAASFSCPLSHNVRLQLRKNAHFC